MVPAVVIFQFFLAGAFVGGSLQRFPSGPWTILRGTLYVGSAYSVTVPVGVILPILLLAPLFVYQTFPSGPSTIPLG